MSDTSGYRTRSTAKTMSQPEVNTSSDIPDDQPLSISAIKAIMKESLAEDIPTMVRNEIAPVRIDVAELKNSVNKALETAEAASLAADCAAKVARDASDEAAAAMNEALQAKSMAMKLIDEMKAVKAGMARHKADQAIQYESQLRMEAHSRSNSLKFVGIKESSNEITEEKVRTYLNKMAASPDVDMVACHRYGPRGRGPRPIMVKFLRHQDRVDIWNKRRALKGTDIFIKEDFPPVIESRRVLLMPVFSINDGSFVSAPFNREPVSR